MDNSNNSDVSSDDVQNSFIDKPVDISNTSYDRHIDKFLQEMMTNMSKRKYRKVLDEIRGKEEILNNSRGFWKILELKSNCICKIITHKLNKYENNKAKSFETWNKRLETILENWLETLDKNDKKCQDFDIQLDYIIYYLLVQIYNYALFSMFDKHIGDCTAFLALGERIIKIFIDSSHNAKTLNISQKIFLFLSSLLISDNDFQTAILYQNLSLKLSLKEINFRLDSDEHLVFESLPPNVQYYLEKVFINIVIGLYQRGICEENLGSIIKAVETYRQSRWFSKFVRNNYYLISDFLEDVETRALKYNNAIKNFQQEILNEEKKIAKDLNKKDKLNMYNKAVDLGDDNLEKYGHALKVINNLKIPKIEEATDKKTSEKIVDILSTVSVVNNFLSDKFKGLVKNMKKLDVVNIDKDMKDKIEKLRNEIKLDEKYDKKKKADLKLKQSIEKTERLKSKAGKDLDSIYSPVLNTVSNTNDTKNHYTGTLGTYGTHNTNATNGTNNTNSSYISTSSPIKKLTEAIGGSRITDNNIGNSGRFTGRFNFDPKRPKESQIITHSTKTPYRVRSAYPRKPKESIEEVPKYNIDEYVFSKEFNNKIDYFEGISSREISYQKKLLGLKKNEKFYIPEFDSMKTRDECEGFFQRTLSNKKKKITGYGDDTTSKRLLIPKEQALVEKEKQRLESTILKSLDTKTYKIFEEFEKKHLKNQNNIIDDPRKKKDIIDFDAEKLRKSNKEYEAKLENDLILMDNYEKTHFKSNNKSKEKKSQNQKIFVHKKERKDMEDFIAPHFNERHSIFK